MHPFFYLSKEKKIGELNSKETLVLVQKSVSHFPKQGNCLPSTTAQLTPISLVQLSGSIIGWGFSLKFKGISRKSVLGIKGFEHFLPKFQHATPCLQGVVWVMNTFLGGRGGGF